MQATGINATISLAPADAGHFTFTANSVKASFGSYLTLQAVASTTQPAIAFDTAAADGYIAQIGTLQATLTAGSLTIGGSASNFDITASGTLDTSKNFGVELNINDPNATASTFQLPTWLPFSISKLALTWPNISNDPANFTIDLSASVNASLGPVTLSGSVQDAVIDVGKLAARQFPIDSLGGGGIAVGGNLFGGKVSGSLFLADEVVGGKTVFYGGIEAGLDIEDLAGFEIRLGISQYGPLDAFVEVNAPIILDPDSGLAVTDLYGEVLFDDPLTPISQPITSAGELLNNAEFTKPDSQTLQQWEDQLGQQVMNQASSSDPWDPFSQPVTIKAGATLFDAYATTNAFELNGNVLICTNGILEASGTLTVGDSISLTGAAYINLSQATSGQAAPRLRGRGSQPGPAGDDLRRHPVPVHRGPHAPELRTGLQPAAGRHRHHAQQRRLDRLRHRENINLNNTSYTVEFWARRNDTGRAETIIGQDDAQTGSDLKVGFDANNNLVVSSGGTTLTYASTDNLWHHWAVAYDQTTSTLTLYEDGPVASNSAQPIQGASTTLTIGDSVCLTTISTAPSTTSACGTSPATPRTSRRTTDWPRWGPAFRDCWPTGRSPRGRATARPTLPERQYPHLRGQSGLVPVARVQPDDHHHWRRRPDHPRPAGRARPVDQRDGQLPHQPEPGDARPERQWHCQPRADRQFPDPGRHRPLRPAGNRTQQHGLSPRHLRHLCRHHPPEFGAGEPGNQPERITVLRFNTTDVSQQETLQIAGQSTPETFTLPPESVSLMAQGTASFTLNNQTWFAINGELDIYFGATTTASGSVDPEFYAYINGALVIGPSSAPYFDFATTGFLQISDQGIAATFNLTLSGSQALAAAGITLGNDKFELTLNTTGQDVSFTPPSITDPNQPGTSPPVNIPAAPNSSSPAESYLEIQAGGSLDIENTIDLSGTFNLLIAPTVIDIGLDANFAFGGVLAFQVQGGLILNTGGSIRSGGRSQPRADRGHPFDLRLQSEYVVPARSEFDWPVPVAGRHQCAGRDQRHQFALCPGPGHGRPAGRQLRHLRYL